MSQLNAIAATASVKDRLLDFCRSDHYVTDSQVDQICQAIWSSPPQNGGLAGDLWVEAAFPPRGCGETMQDHVAAGLISRGLADLLDRNRAFQLDWELREIQSESVKAARARDGSETKPAIVVSAGTGAGKTESFLFPMLDELMRNPRTPHAGASAIILYPMNALVTDQVERLTNWLQGQTKLKIFHFTGETPENYKAANSSGYPSVADCCFRTRQQARGLETEKGKVLPEPDRADQPDVIVTNYSMLEYMLCRPQDAVFFGKNLRHLVLDEAHLYTGNLAAEITLLLRRLAIKCGVDVATINHYATSATLVEGKESEQRAALARFASKIFSKAESDVSVVLGRKSESGVGAPASRSPAPCPESENAWPQLSGIEETAGVDRMVTSDDDAWQQWTNALGALLPSLDLEWGEPKQICRFLHRKLPEQPVFQHLYYLLYENRIQPLDTLAELVWGESSETAREATRRLLQAGAIARAEATTSPLLPNRIHWSIRAPNGLFFSFAYEYAPSETQIYRIDGAPVGYFYSPSYYSRPEEDKSHPLLVLRNADNGEWLLAGIEKGSCLVVSEEALPKTKERLLALLERLSFFRLEDMAGPVGTLLEYDPISGKVGDPGGIRLRKVGFSEQEKKSLRPLGSDSRLQLSVIAEGTLMEMPPFPGDSKRWKPAAGRRLLIFSDSRSEAATLGPSLTGNHERQLFRALVVEGLKQLGEGNTTEGARQIAELEQTLAIVPEVAKGAIQSKIDELTAKREESVVGRSPSDFVEKLKSCKRVNEFFDRKEGERHNVSKWSQKMFELNRTAVCATFSHRLSQELARKTLWPDLNLESAGFLELVYPNIESIQLPPDYLGKLPSAELRTQLNKSFPFFVGMVLDHVRDLGGITLGSDVIDSEYGIGGGYIGKWVSLESRFKNSLLPLITTRADSLLGNFTRLYLSEAGMINPGEVEGKELLEAFFKQLYENKRLGRIDWLEFDQRQSDNNLSALAMRLQFSALRIRRPLALYQCEESGQVWPRSALGCHLRSKRSSLKPISPEQLAENPRIARVHREWGSSEVFRSGLWAEEHSAQIGATENRRLQDLFKAGIRNVLSSTTTLELGIDIGGLNGVMMGNIPPGKASYLQRAGRAGRRADGSALVISYSRNSPYERKVFEDFGAYLATPLREPSVFLDRKDIVRRHVHSLLFSEFFSRAYGGGLTRGAMEAFGGMGAFSNIAQTAYWGSGEPKPMTTPRNAQVDLDKDFPWGKGCSSIADAFDRFLVDMEAKIDGSLAEGIRELTRETGLEAGTAAEQGALVGELRKQVQHRMDSWLNDYKRLLQQWTGIPSDADPTHRNLANALHHQLKQLYAMTLIESFSDSMILPRYGFPIGLSELKVNPGKVPRSQNTTQLSEAYRLNRSASQAVTEYAPGSKILAGAKTIHSQGILKSWTGDDIPNDGMGLRAWYRWDEKSGDFHYQYDRFDAGGIQPLANFSQQGEMIFVKHGFTTSASEPPTYGGSRSRVGEVLTICRPPEDPTMTTAFTDFFGMAGVNARLHVGGELLALNAGAYGQGFAVCTKCGFSRSEVVGNKGGVNTGRVGLPKGFDWHSPIHNVDSRSYCWKQDETFVLRHLHLSARQVCDFLEIDLPQIFGDGNERRRIGNTICQALRLSGAQLLNIDSREISLLRPTSGTITRISLCDSVAGGAGHVRDLSNATTDWWRGAMQMIRMDNITQATLGLLTADVPSREGLPDICIESTIRYLDRIGFQTPPPRSESGNMPEQSDPDKFSKYLKK